jgi:Ran GTPase-activating protein (RanGAP) involved in mRNA processing and transport
MDPARTIHCPIKGPLPAPDCPPAELAPLLGALCESRPVAAPRAFPRGTLLPDGRLDLCKQGLGVDGCRAVTAALAGNTVVRSLLLGTNGIGDAGAAAVADLLAVNRTLQVVYLGCNGIGAAGTETLTAAVAANPAVTGLWLKRNPVGAGGARAVADLVRRGSAVRVLDLVNTCPAESALLDVIGAVETGTVESLYLGGNALDAAWGVPLAAMVARTTTLRGLFLSVNRLGDAGAESLAVGLARNRSLAALSLASNGIGPAGLAAVARSLTAHPTLEWLDLGYAPSTRVLGCAANRVGGEAVDALVELVASAPHLAELNLSANGIDRADLERLADAARHSPGLMSVAYTGPRVAALDRVLADRRTGTAWGQPPRPDLSLIRSVYR